MANYSVMLKTMVYTSVEIDTDDIHDLPDDIDVDDIEEVRDYLVDYAVDNAPGFGWNIDADEWELDGDDADAIRSE